MPTYTDDQQPQGIASLQFIEKELKLSLRLLPNQTGSRAQPDWAGNAGSEEKENRSSKRKEQQKTLQMGGFRWVMLLMKSLSLIWRQWNLSKRKKRSPSKRLWPKLSVSWMIWRSLDYLQWTTANLQVNNTKGRNNHVCYGFLSLLRASKSSLRKLKSISTSSEIYHKNTF